MDSRLQLTSLKSGFAQQRLNYAIFSLSNFRSFLLNREMKESCHPALKPRKLSASLVVSPMKTIWKKNSFNAPTTGRFFISLFLFKKHSPIQPTRSQSQNLMITKNKQLNSSTVGNYILMLNDQEYQTPSLMEKPVTSHIRHTLMLTFWWFNLNLKHYTKCIIMC
jgi:hypothetical protein